MKGKQVFFRLLHGARILRANSWTVQERREWMRTVRLQARASGEIV